MSADDIPFVVLPWDENKMPLIKRVAKTPKKYITGPSQNVDILGLPNTVAIRHADQTMLTFETFNSVFFIVAMLRQSKNGP